jgi:hypothetical protein
MGSIMAREALSIRAHQRTSAAPMLLRLLHIKAYQLPP